MSRGVIPPGFNDTRISIMCTKDQLDYIRKAGCIAFNDDICNVDFCDKCPYCPNNFHFIILDEYVIKGHE
jgi:hypothetical protein